MYNAGNEAFSIKTGLDRVFSAKPSDNDLLEAIANEDAGAFRLLLERYLPKMVVCARRITWNTQDANEIAQEAFLRVWKNAHKWDANGTATFETWLYRVTTNLAISSKRKQRDEVSLDAANDIESTHLEGFDLIHESNRKAVVGQAISKLPPRQRAAVAAFYFDENSHAVAAERMDLSAKAFDALLVRARRNLKKLLDEMGIKSLEEYL